MTRVLVLYYSSYGHVETLEETIEEFSADGRPLRATVAVALARREIGPYAFRGAS